ncbi:MAG: ATP-binding cassette domain-containing protein [Sarcina sp.]
MIKLVNVNKRYKDKVVLDNVNLELQKGEIIGVLAPNGVGKSTLLKILGGQIVFDSGEYYFEGEKINPKHKEKIGYMSDRSIIPGGWKVIEAIEYYEKYFKQFNREQCENMLKEFEIEKDEILKSLSKGQNEKVHLALALSIKGSLYIMDEPLGAIDLIAREEIIRMILDKFEIDSTMIISSHLVSEIEGLLDRVIFLKDGKIVSNRLVEDLRSEGKSVVELYREVF